MGQQQLLLIVLVAIIVGVMTIVAITTMEQTADQIFVDGARDHILQVASTAQGYYQKPAMMGGGGKSFINVTPKAVNLDTLNEYGTFEITETAQNYFKIVATPSEGDVILTANIYPSEVEWE